MYEHPRGGKNNFGDAKNGPPDSYMYFMNQIKVTVTLIWFMKYIEKNYEKLRETLRNLHKTL